MIWKARSIWLSGDEEEGGALVSLRRRFRLGERPRVAPAFVASTAPYRLFVNGAPIGRGPAAAPPGLRYFDSYDLTPFLQRGLNVLAALCRPPVPLPPGPTPRPGFQLQAAMERGDDPPIEILTDETWMGRRQRWTGGAVTGEEWWVTAGFGDWLRPEFDETAWERARALRDELSAPLPRPVPALVESRLSPVGEIESGAPAGPWPLAAPARTVEGRGPEAAAVGSRATRNLPARRAVAGAKGGATAAGTAGGRRIFDFGRHAVGYPQLRVARVAAGVVEVTSGDALAPDGSVRPGCGVGTDRWLLKGTGEPIELETFHARSLRYLQVEVRGGADLERVAVRQAVYPWEPRGRFECSDETLTRIWALGRDTLACGTRDTLLSWGDEAGPARLAEARTQALVVCSAFGDTRLARKLILETVGEPVAPPAARAPAQLRRLPGVLAVGGSSPRGEAGGGVLVLDEEAAWVLMVWEYFLHGGDRRLLQDLYPQVQARLSRLLAHTDEFGVLNTGSPPRVRAGVWVDDAPLDRRGAVTAANAFYHRALLTAARIAASVADLPAQREYEHRALALRSAVNWRLWSERERAYADCRTAHGLSQRAGAETNWLAIAFGLAEPRRARALHEWLTREDAGVPEVSPFFQNYVLEALFLLGDHAGACRRIARLWGAVLAAGATTCWQQWPAPTDAAEGRRDDAEMRGRGEAATDGDLCAVTAPHRLVASPPEGSACWGPAAAPTHFLTAEVLGARPLAPGWRRACVRPALGDLEWARGVAPTPPGDLAVESRRRGERAVDLAVSIPAGMRVELGLGDVREGDVVEWEGRVIWPAAQAHPGVELETLPQWGCSGWSWSVSGPREVLLRVRDGRCRGAGVQGCRGGKPDAERGRE